MIFRQQKSVGPYLTIIRASLGLMMFLLPLWYLTAFPEAWELPKALVFGIGVTVAAVTWLIWSVRTRRLQASFGTFEALLACFLGVAALSTALSVHRYSSLWGMSGLQSESFAMMFFGALFAFLLKQTTDDAAVRWYLALLFSSLGLGALGALFTMGGIPVFPGHELGKGFVPTGASPDVFALLLAAAWLVAWLVRRTSVSFVFRRLLDAALALWLIVMIVLDRPRALVFVLGGALLLGLVTWPKRFERQTHLWLAIAIGAAIVVLALPIRSHISLPVNAEVTLPSSTAFSVTARAVSHVPIFGSGPGTFLYDFVKYRSADFESLATGSLRFVRPDSGWLQTLATFGIVGVAAFVSLLAWTGSRAFRVRTGRSSIRRRPKSDPAFAWLLVWLGLGLFVTSGSMVVTVLVWAALGLAAATGRESEQLNKDKQSAGRAIGAAIAGFLVLISAWYGLGRIWSAPIFIAKANRAIAATEPLATVGTAIDKAIALDPWNSGYQLKRAEFRLIQFQYQNRTPDEASITGVLDDVRRAEQLDPKNPAVSERSIQLIGQLLTVKPALSSDVFSRYGKLTSTEPNSARNYVAWAKAELVLAQAEKEDKTVAVDQALVRSALGHVGQALALKPGDLDARYHQALAHELLGDRTIAKGIMRELAVQYPNEVDILYELAREERLDAQYDEAIRLLNLALDQAPKSLAIRAEIARAYEGKGEKDQAIAMLKVLDQMSPNTPDITDWLKRLQVEPSN